MKHHFIKSSPLLTLLLLPALSQAQALTVGETTIGWGGYIKLDGFLTETEYGDLAFPGRDFYVPALTPVAGDSEGVKMDFHARQSRVFFTTTTPLSNGKNLAARIELDMMSTAGGDERITNGYSPGVRHAFFTYDAWLFGQTWSTFMDVNSLPDTLDFIGNTDGTVFVRQAQVRYTMGSFQIGIENPETTLTPFGGGTRIVTDDNNMPDVVLRYNLAGDWGSFSVSGLARQLKYDVGTADDSERAYGASIGAKINLDNGNDLRFTVTTGEGVGRYLALNTINDGVLTAADETGGIETLDVTGFAVAYRHVWNDQWRTNVIYSDLRADNELAYTGGGATEKTASGAVNLMYQAASKLMFGVEARYANREIESGADGDLRRLQFTAKYDF